MTLRHWWFPITSIYRGGIGPLYILISNVTFLNTRKRRGDAYLGTHYLQRRSGGHTMAWNTHQIFILYVYAGRKSWFASTYDGLAFVVPYSGDLCRSRCPSSVGSLWTRFSKQLSANKTFIKTDSLKICLAIDTEKKSKFI